MKKSEKGFTLIEMVMTIVITGILAYIFLNFFSLGTDSYNLIEKQSDLIQEGRIFLQRIVREIQQAGPLDITSATEITFTYDDNSDGINETYRYFLSGNSLHQTINGTNDTIVLDNIGSLSFKGDKNHLYIMFTLKRTEQSLAVETYILRRTSLT